VTWLRLDCTGFEVRQRKEILFYYKMSRPVLGSTKPSIQWLWGFFSGGKAAGTWSWPLTFIWWSDLVTVPVWPRGWVALIFHDRGTRRGWVVSNTLRQDFTPGKDPVPILQEAGWAPGPVWMGGKSRPHRDLIPDRPAPTQSLYPLS